MVKLGSLTATDDLRVECLSIVLVEDVRSNVGGVVVVNHRCF